MADTFTISLPEGVSEDDIKEIKNLLKEIDSVDDAGSVSSRSGIDPASIMLWVQLATGVLGVTSTGIVIAQKLKELFQKKRVSGARVKLPNGTEISLDTGSAEEIAKIIEAAK